MRETNFRPTQQNAEKLRRGGGFSELRHFQIARSEKT